MNRALTTLAALLLALTSVAFIGAAATLAADAPSRCGTYDEMQVTVFRDTQQGGTYDSLCIPWVANIGAYKDDDTFNGDDLASFHDIGQSANMHDKVSSYALENHMGASPMTVCVYKNENQGGGLIKRMVALAGEKKNFEQGIFDNDTADSLRAYKSLQSCP